MGGLYTECPAEKLPNGASPLCINTDFIVGQTTQRPGKQSVYSFANSFVEKVAAFAASVAGSHAPNETAWTDPSNVTLNLPGTYASVSLNSGGPSEILQAISGSNIFGVTLPNPISAGSKLIYAVGIFTAFDVDTTGAADTDDNSWATATKSLASADWNYFLYECDAPNTGGSPTVQAVITGSPSQEPAILIEISGLTNSAFDQSAIGRGTNETAMDSGPTSPTSQADEMVFGFGFSATSEGNVRLTTGVGYADIPGLTSPYVGWGEYKVVNTIGAQDAVMTNDGSSNYWLLACATFKTGSTPTGPYSEVLECLNFPFSLSSTVVPLGFQVEISGHQTSLAADTILTVSLLHPNATSPTFICQLPISDGIVTVATPTEDWGLALTPALFNDPNFGVKIVASATNSTPVTFDIYAVKIKLWVTPDPPPSFNYIKTFAQTNGEVLTMALGDDGVFYQEDVLNNPGVLEAVYTAVEPDSFAQSATVDDREFIAISNLQNGTDIPYGYDGTNFDRLSQVGPGAPPSASTSSSGNTILTITQPSAKSDVESPGHLSDILWSAGPGNSSPGNTLTIYYSRDAVLPNPDADLQPGVGVQLANIAPIQGNTVNGDYIVTSVGLGIPPGGQYGRWYFTVQMPTSLFVNLGGGEPSPQTGTYQVTTATMTTASQVPNLEVNTQFAIAGTGGSPPAGYDGTWTVLTTPNASQLQITSTELTGNVATYGYNLITGTNPVLGQAITVTQTLNGNGIFNVAQAIIVATSPGTFSLNIVSATNIPTAAETGSGIVFGTIFTFDPLMIVGNKSGGSIVTAGVITLGVRKICYSFLTRNGFITQPSPILTLDIIAGASTLVVSGLLTGPDDVIARIVHLTAADGGNFYNIPAPVSVIDNGVTVINSSTWVLDNTSTSVTLSFSDGVLLAADQVDIQGNNLFECAELGSCVALVPYAQRLVAIGEQNKISNLLNYSFDGGFTGSAGAFTPAGWIADPTSGAGGTVIASPIFGFAYQIANTTGTTQATYGMITQNAYQDEFQIPIIDASTAYSVRVTVAVPTGASGGNLVVDLFSKNLGTVLGTFSLPLASIATSMEIDTGTLLTSVLAPVPNDLVIRLYATNIPNGVTVNIDRVEPFPTMAPNLNTQVTLSYKGNFEAFDQLSGVILGTNQNQQPIVSAFILFDSLYLVKSGSMISVTDNNTTEPSGWATPRTISNSVGTAGVNAVTTGIDEPNAGEEWAITAYQPGLFMFYGGQPVKLSEEIQSLWNMINWKYGYTIWVKNDITERRILVGVPLRPTNAQGKVSSFLPAGILTDPNPTTPNAVLMLNYKQLNTANTLADSPEVHRSYSGKLLASELTRKWAIWILKSPCAGLIERADTTTPVFLGNSDHTGKIYQLVDGLLEDDGNAILQMYDTYGFVPTEEGEGRQMGVTRFCYDYMSLLLDGSGACTISVFPNTLDTPYAHALLPDLTLPASTNGDVEVPVNEVGNRLFVQFKSNAVGAGFILSRVIMCMSQDPWASVRGVNN
jgi:hypothetical protein